MKEEKQINVTVDKDTKELVIRHGTAAEIFKKIKTTLVGTIDAPRKFFEKRSAQHKAELCHVVYDRNKMEIVLRVDEDDKEGTEITGRLVHDPDLSEFAINSTCKTYTVKELQNFLKMRKFFFSDADEATKIVTNLGKFKATVEKQIEEEFSTRGNQKSSFEVKVNTELAMHFTLNMPIFKGLPAMKFKVEICFDVREKSISIWLESAELRELEIKMRNEIIEKELKAFESIVVIEK